MSSRPNGFAPARPRPPRLKPRDAGRVALRTRTRLPAPEAQPMAGRSLAMTLMLTFYEFIKGGIHLTQVPTTSCGRQFCGLGRA